MSATDVKLTIFFFFNLLACHLASINVKRSLTSTYAMQPVLLKSVLLLPHLIYGSITGH